MVTRRPSKSELGVRVRLHVPNFTREIGMNRFVVSTVAEFFECFDTEESMSVFVSEDETAVRSVALRLNAGEDMDTVIGSL